MDILTGICVTILAGLAAIWWFEAAEEAKKKGALKMTQEELNYERMCTGQTARGLAEDQAEHDHTEDAIQNQDRAGIGSVRVTEQTRASVSRKMVG